MGYLASLVVACLVDHIVAAVVEEPCMGFVVVPSLAVAATCLVVAHSMAVVVALVIPTSTAVGKQVAPMVTWETLAVPEVLNTFVIKVASLVVVRSSFLYVFRIFNNYIKRYLSQFKVASIHLAGVLGFWGFFV